MAKVFYIQSQVPVAELPVVSEKDAEGKTQTIQVGFRRHDADVAATLLEKFSGKAPDGSDHTISDDEVKALLKDEIIFIKKGAVVAFDEEDTAFLKPEVIKVEDTRTAKAVESFWDSKEECLSVLVDMYLASTPWKGSLISAYIQSLVNIDIAAKEKSAKNS